MVMEKALDVILQLGPPGFFLTFHQRHLLIKVLWACQSPCLKPTPGYCPGVADDQRAFDLRNVIDFASPVNSRICKSKVYALHVRA